MFDVGGGELLLIVLAILVLFGPKKIPEVATMVGKGMRKVRQAQDEFTTHLRTISTEMEEASDVRSAASSAKEVTSSLASDIQSLPEAEVINGNEVPDNSVGDDLSQAQYNHEPLLNQTEKSFSEAHVDVSTLSTRTTPTEAAADSPPSTQDLSTAPRITLQPAIGNVAR